MNKFIENASRVDTCDLYKSILILDQSDNHYHYCHYRFRSYRTLVPMMREYKGKWAHRDILKNGIWDWLDYET